MKREGGFYPGGLVTQVQGLWSEMPTTLALLRGPGLSSPLANKRAGSGWLHKCVSVVVHCPQSGGRCGLASSVWQAGEGQGDHRGCAHEVVDLTPITFYLVGPLVKGVLRAPLTSLQCLFRKCPFLHLCFPVQTPSHQQFRPIPRALLPSLVC